MPPLFNRPLVPSASCHKRVSGGTEGRTTLREPSAPPNEIEALGAAGARGLANRRHRCSAALSVRGRVPLHEHFARLVVDAKLLLVAQRSVSLPKVPICTSHVLGWRVPVKVVSKSQCVVSF